MYRMRTHRLLPRPRKSSGGARRVERPSVNREPFSAADWTELFVDRPDLPLNFHPAAIRASEMVYAVRRGWSNMRSAELVGVAQPIACCGEIGGVGRRGEIAQRRVRPPLVVVVDPGRDLRRGRDRGRGTGVSLRSSSRMRPLKLSQKPFCIGFPGAMKCQTILLSCAQASIALRGELGPIVGDDHAGLAASFDQRRQFARHATAGDRRVGDRRQAFPRHVIDDIEDAEPPAAGELVVDKIQRPARVGVRLDQDRRPRPTAAAAARRLRTVRPSSR